MRDLTRGPLGTHIVAMAIPIAVGMLVQTAYYLVDLYFVSRLGDTALAGVGTAGNVMFLVLALTQSLSVGTIALVSQAVGRDDRDRANLVFNQAAGIAGILAVATLAAGYFGLANRYVASIGANAETIAAATTYLRWFVPALALQFVMVAMGAALQGTGIVKPTMMVQMTTVAVNVILTPILVAGWVTGRPLGVLGAGLSSSIAAAVGTLLLTFYFVKLEKYVRFNPRQWRPRAAVVGKMAAIGIPAGGEFALMFLYLAVIYGVIRVFGSTAQAGFGVGVRVMQAVFLPAMAIAFATPAIAGQNYGAGLADRVRGTFRTAALMSVGIMLLLSFLCQIRPEWLVGPFSGDAEVAGVAAGFMRIVSWNFVATGLIFSCSGMFQAMGNTWPSLSSTGTRLLTFAFPVLWLARQPGFRIEHVWYASVATVALQAAMSLTLLAWQFRKRLRFQRDPKIAARSVY